jgi:serine/threonine protein kinase
VYHVRHIERRWRNNLAVGFTSLFDHHFVTREYTLSMGNCMSDAAVGEGPTAPRREVAHTGCYIPARSQLHRQKRSSDANAGGETSEQAPDNEHKEKEDPMNSLLLELAPLRLDEAEVVTTDKTNGSYSGQLWLGHYLGQPVVVKRFFMYQETSPPLLNEIQTMTRLQHPRIVRFFGCVWTSSKNLGVVSEHVDGRTLHSLLESSTIELSWSREKISIATDIVEALAHMHSLSPPVLHNDLRSRTLLLDAKMCAKLSNFGLGRNYIHPMLLNFSGAPWMAPEVLRGGEDFYTTASDVYSLGTLLSQLDTREVPFKKEISNRSAPPARFIVHIALGKIHPSFTPDCPAEILEIARECLQYDAELRPSSESVAKMLKSGRAMMQGFGDAQSGTSD